MTTALETLHRVHQITPSNDAMKVLLDKGLHSAYDVVATSETEFLARYGPFFPTREQARLVYRKSEQVSAVLYNFHAMAAQAVSSSVLVPVQGSGQTREAAVERIRRRCRRPRWSRCSAPWTSASASTAVRCSARRRTSSTS